MPTQTIHCKHDELVDCDKLIPHAKNYNTHPKSQIEKLARVLELNGVRHPIIVSKRSGFIVAGHGRLEAANLNKWEKMPVVYQEFENEAKEYAFMISDNKIAELAVQDGEKLNALIAEMNGKVDFGSLGMKESELNQILASMAAKVEGEDDVPAAPQVAKTVKSDLYEIGQHRLLCGDGTVAANAVKLMNGELVDELVTDPPYNVAYVGKTKDAMTIENDKMSNDDFRLFLKAAFAVADSVMKPGAVFYIWHADSEGFNFRGACHDIGWQVRQCLVWNKNTMVMGRQDYHWKHEPCLYGWKEGSGHLWASDRTQTTILNFDRPSSSLDDPTTKPVDLFAYQIGNNTKEMDVVLDLFGGSGTTMIAAQKLNRKARLIEIDPKYCDVVVTRMHKLYPNLEIKLNGNKIDWQ